MNNSFYKQNAAWHLNMADRELANAIHCYERSLINLARGQLVRNDKLEKIKEKLITVANEMKAEVHTITGKNQ